jgi:RNA recognition motif-containing protein
MPALHYVDTQTNFKVDKDFDGLSDSTRCPDSPRTVVSEKPQAKETERKDKMLKFCKNKAEHNKTTVMIRNVPCKLSQDELIAEVSLVSKSFNFLYLPSSKKAVGNLGYAFVNFTDNAECVKFLENFADHIFESAPRSKKRALVAYATLQGFKENVRFFKRSRVGKSENGPFIVQN